MHIVNDRRDRGTTAVPERAEPRPTPTPPQRSKRRSTWMRWAVVLGGLFAVVAIAAAIGFVIGSDDQPATLPVFERAEARTPAGFVPTGADAPEGTFVAVPDPIAPRIAFGFAPTGWESPEHAPIQMEPVTIEPRVPEGFAPAG